MMMMMLLNVVTKNKCQDVSRASPGGVSAHGSTIVMARPPPAGSGLFLGTSDRFF